jgi:hypothetical protein
VGDPESHSISEQLERYIDRLIPAGSTILELGSGHGTLRLAARFRMVSIEHDERFIGLAPSTYIHAPITPFRKPCAVFADDEGWYDRAVLRRELPGRSYNLILVDGPPNYIGRGGFYKYKELFNLNVPMIFDDAHRPRVIQLLQRFSAHLRRPYTVHGCWDDRHFGVILP